MALFSKFFGRTISDAAGFALGGAMRSPLEPPLQELTNETWREFVKAGITVPTDPGDAAEIVAEDVALESWALDQAAQLGYGGDQMDKLIKATRNAPGLGELLRMLRRGKIKPADFIHGLRKARLELLWDDGLTDLQNEYLDPAVIATAIQRGIMSDPGFLPVAPPTATGNVASFPVSPLDPLNEAAAAGINKERLFVETALVGNPMGPVEAARAFFRGILQRPDFDRAIAEGRTRNEWGDAILNEARQIPTSDQFVVNHLRGYSDESAMLAGTARHGMSPQDTNVLFENAGRPLGIHAITTGLARGGKFQPIPGQLTDPYEAYVHESSLKPGYYDLAIANKYSYPSLFQLNALVKANAITADIAKDWATKDGYAPEVVDALFTFWQGEQAAAAGGEPTKPKTYTYSQIHQAQRTHVFTDAQALAELEAIGYSPAHAQTLLATWKATEPPPA